MKKLILIAFVAFLTSCGSAYNTQLKQVELGMTQEQIVTLMGDKYTSPSANTLEYKDKYKNHWFFQFQDNKLVKWYKETEE